MREDVVPGSFVEIRGRSWVMKAVAGNPGDLQPVSLSHISDDAQGEHVELLWDAEIGARVLDDDAWTGVGRGVPDSAEVWADAVRAASHGRAAAGTHLRVVK